MRALEEQQKQQYPEWPGCGHWDDRLVKQKNPMWRETDGKCYVTPIDANGDTGCHLMSRNDDFRWCYCQWEA
jgi:hypothetical protein